MYVRLAGILMDKEIYVKISACVSQEGAQRLQVLMKQVPDLTIDVQDAIADGDKVVVRAVWSGTDAVSQRKVEFHGFVQRRIADGKFAERWATVTPIVEMPEGTNTLHW
jgi:predicted ester cyclase